MRDNLEQSTRDQIIASLSANSASLRTEETDMKIGDRVKPLGRRVAATVIDVRQSPGGPNMVLLEFDKPVCYSTSEFPFRIAWFGAAECSALAGLREA